MKILLGRRKQRSDKLIKEKFGKLHQIINKSTVTVYNRKEKNVDVQNIVTTDDSVTNITDGSCEILFNNVFYDFLTNVLPEERKQTEVKLSIISFLISKSKELKEIYNKEGFVLFFNNLSSGIYDGYMDEDMIIELRRYDLIDFSSEEEFVLIAEDSNGTEFSRSNSFVRSKILPGSSFSIKCPMNDSDTTVKDGFNPNEEPQFFYKNTYNNYKTKIDIVAPSLALADLKTIVVTNILISEQEIIKYNPTLHQLIHGSNK